MYSFEYLDYPLALVWPSKQPKIYQINTETSIISIKTNGDSGVLEFGYGVSPKAIFVPDQRAPFLYYVYHQPHSQNCMGVFRVCDAGR